MTKLLVDAGADLEQELADDYLGDSERGDTPLHAAGCGSEGHSKVVSGLIEAGRIPTAAP